MSASTQGAQAPANPFRTLWDLGYTRLVPIVPPKAGVSEKSSLAARMRAGQDARGKVPGVRGDDGLWRGLQFVAMEAHEQDLDAWNAMGAGVGIKTGDGLIAVDIDTRDKKAARTIHEIAMRTLGPAHVRFGNHPKCLLLYEGPENATYKKVSFSTDTEEKAAVELLTEGRQFVAHGVHPGTGKPYVWQNGTPRRQALTTITAEKIGAFLQGVAETLPGARVQNSADDHEAPDQESLQAPSWDALKLAVEAMPNTQALFPTRNDYVKVAYAIKGAAPDGYEHEALELYLDWCARWDGGDNDPDVALADWHRAKPPFRTGYSFIRNHAPGLYFEAQEMEHAGSIGATDVDEMFEVQRPAARIVLFADEDIQNKPDPTWLIEGFLPEHGFSMLYGDPGTGKSFLALDMGLHIATGQPEWHGQTIHKATAGPVLYIAGEGESDFKLRLNAWKAKHLFPGATIPRDNFRAIFAPMDFRNAADVDLLLAAIAHEDFRNVALTVIDTVARVTPGADENAAQDMGLLVRAVDRIRGLTGSAALAVHHTNKAGSMRGSSALLGAADAVFVFARKRGAAIGKLACEKMKAGPDDVRAAFRLDLVSLPGGKDSLVPVRVEEKEMEEALCTDEIKAEIFAAIRRDGAAGNHWSTAAQARSAGRKYAAHEIATGWKVGEDVAEQWLDLWMTGPEPELRVEIVDSTSKRRGIVVIDKAGEGDIFG